MNKYTLFSTSKIKDRANCFIATSTVSHLIPTCPEAFCLLGHPISIHKGVSFIALSLTLIFPEAFLNAEWSFYYIRFSGDVKQALWFACDLGMKKTGRRYSMKYAKRGEPPSV